MSVVLMDAAAMRRTLGRMAHEILEANDGGENLVVVGIQSGGVPVAKRLAFMMTQVEGYTIPSGKLDIRRYRDDRPADQEDASEIPFQVDGRTVILVDDVIFTGRSVRAAMDAMMHFGRPASIQLAVLVDRGHRELPIQPDYCGVTLHTERDDHITVNSHEGNLEEGVILEPGESSEA